MKKTPENILKASLNLFNKQGVANVSIRNISSELKISHSNLIYHFPDKNAIVYSLHEEMMQKAIQLNKQIKQIENPIEGIFESAKIGFAVLYEYRFLMLDFNFIMRENKELHKIIKGIEQLRTSMYKEEIERAISLKLIREPDFEFEYDLLIKRIHIFSDAWLSHAEVYETNFNSKIIDKYTTLLLDFFYPYLTSKGKKAWKNLIET